MTIAPAYGRDYKSKKEVIQSLAENKDFLVVDFMNGGGYINYEQLKIENILSVTVRYKKLASVTVVKLSEIEKVRGSK